MTATLTGLFIYPVKSCRGIALRESRVTARGLDHDREWMIVDATGNFLTQRQLPRMALIETQLTRDALVLSSAGANPIEVPLQNAARELRSVQVWRHECGAFDEDDDAAHWLSDLLDRPVRLVRFDPEHRRSSNREWTGGIAAENRFTDGYPMLLVSEESLDELNRRLGDAGPLPMDRFRPNVVIRGVGAHGEDRLRSLHVGDIELRPIKPCTRCPITATDQRSAVTGAEPLRTLATYRRDQRLGGVTFGMNTILAAGDGLTLRVGTVLTAD
jgi:hypothetical protein